MITLRNFTLLLCLILIISCASSFKEKCTGPNCVIKTAVHSVTYSGKGTRSEAKHGHLTIDNIEIPDVFTLVISGYNTWKFHQRTQMWGLDGYFPVKNDKINKTDISSQEISLQQIRKGWYNGSALLVNTPSDWFYAEWENGNAFIAPDAIQNIIRELNLKIIPRWEGPKVLKKP